MGNNKVRQITSGKLKEKNESCFPDIAKASVGFCYFTRIDTAEKMLSGDKGEIWVSPISKMNDLHEREMHGFDGDYAYGLCFCNSEIDNIPMWYLYGGITGKGARIKITAKRMQKFIKSIEYVYAVDNSKKGEQLYRDIDFDIKYGWIYYREDRHLIRYRDTYYSLLDSLDRFEKNNYFVKDMAWRYEKEFRIVFHLRPQNGRKAPEKIALPLNKKLLMKYGGLSVKLAPELQKEMASENGIVDYARKFGIPESKVSFSKLKIQMDLVQRNGDAILGEFPGILARVREDKAFRVCEQLQAAEYCKRADGSSKTEKELCEVATV